MATVDPTVYPKPFDPSDTKGTPRELLVNIKKGIQPTLKKGLEDQQAGEITIPRLARGVLTGTLVGDLNNQLETSCDWILEARKNLYLRDFIAAIGAAIKQGIVAISDALGFEPTGTLSRVIAFLRSTSVFLQYIKINFIDPIIEFQKYVIIYIQQIKAIIEFINNLPAKLKELLRNCLRKAIALLNSVFTDILTDSLSGEDGIGDAIRAAQEVAKNVTDVRTGVENIIKNGSTIVNEVKEINLNIDVNSVSFSDILPSKSDIENYIKKIPDAAAVILANPPPQQQKSSP